ncbi:hypothetical protein FEZ63_11990 [Microvirga brassicacearum]|uniref:Polyphosphate kinase-2-related domain-containing protein n=1 Tax=Microvirga brassicacearum TaxID=2580413 RepID=A0A5N3PAV5_9HYPH|nr:hypothetical protein FEZ63_11990 [Microvirga brassicacearum]
MGGRLQGGLVRLQRWVKHTGSRIVILFEGRDAAGKGYDYWRARDAMLAATDTDLSPWYVIKGDDKRRARLNCISHTSLSRVMMLMCYLHPRQYGRLQC